MIPQIYSVNYSFRTTFKSTLVGELWIMQIRFMRCCWWGVMMIAVVMMPLMKVVIQSAEMMYELMVFAVLFRAAGWWTNVLFRNTSSDAAFTGERWFVECEPYDLIFYIHLSLKGHCSLSPERYNMIVCTSIILKYIQTFRKHSLKCFLLLLQFNFCSPSSLQDQMLVYHDWKRW